MKKLVLSFLLLSAFATATQAQIISTIAGNGTVVTGGEGIPATSTGCNAVQIAMDSHGNIYYPEGNTVRKRDTAGYVTTIAGTGTAGYSGDGGAATAAQLHLPEGIAIDNADNIYITETDPVYFASIRKIDVTGLITTYAGTTAALVGGDGDEGPATNAKFLHMVGLYFSRASNSLYLADNNTQIRRIDAGGIIHLVTGKNGITPLTGDGGPATAATVSGINQMATDHAGNLFFYDGANELRKIDGAGIISTYIPSRPPGDAGDGGPATAAVYNTMNSICIDSKDNIYLGSYNGGRVRRIDAATGIVTTFAGTTEGYSGDGGPATAAQLGRGMPYLLTDCGDNIYVNDDATNGRLRKITVLHSPWYVGEQNQLKVCQNSTSNPCGGLLGAASPGTGEAIEWSMSMAPKHGTLGGLPYSTVVTTGTITPTPITYTPAAGYLGTDSFTIDLDCSQVGRSKTIYVTVEVPPTVAAITGTATALCKGKTLALANATAGGVWSAASTAVSVSAGVVTGVATGTTTISYTIADGGCASSATYAVEVKECGLGTSPRPLNPSAPKGELLLYPNPAGDVIHIETLAKNCTYRLQNMLGAEVLSGTLDGNAGNVINVQHVAAGVYMLEVTDAQTGERMTRRVVKE